MRFGVRSLASLSELRIWCCHELWCRLQMRLTNLEWLWLWCRPEAIALIGPQAWEPLYALGVALGSRKKKKKKMWYRSFLVA